MGKCCEMHPPCVTHEKYQLAGKKVTAGFMPDTQQGYGLGAETALPSRNWIELRAFRKKQPFCIVLKMMSKQDERGTDLP